MPKNLPRINSMQGGFDSCIAPAKSAHFFSRKWKQGIQLVTRILISRFRAKKPSKASKEPMKVKYISSPVMVNAKSAAEFKAIVQELTGKDSSDDGHHQRSPEDAGGRATINEYSQGPFNYGGTNAKLGYGADQFQGSSTMGSNEHGEDLFWKLSQSLSRCEYPYG